MTNLLKRLRQKAVLWLFNRYFSNLVFGFETADKKIEKMSETQKTMYYEAVTAWVESGAYAIEDKSKIEECYKKLATEATTDDLLTAYRLALLLMKNQDIRLRGKVDEYNRIRAARRSFNQVNKV